MFQTSPHATSKPLPCLSRTFIFDLSAEMSLKEQSKRCDKNKMALCFQALKKKGIVLVGIKENLVDRVWTKRPGEELLNISVQELSYTGIYNVFIALTFCRFFKTFGAWIILQGKKWSKKVQEVQAEMKNVGASAHVVMELDSISCKPVFAHFNQHSLCSHFIHMHFFL